jgi:mannose-6-phosphate isomerase-like protein (cupin superfamily)
MSIQVVKLAEKFNLFNEHWSPKLVGVVNDTQIKLVKLQGEFVWHHHEYEDEMFFVVKGTLVIKLRDQDLTIKESEFVIIPKGVEHLPVAKEEVWIMLVELGSTLNTGTETNERTVIPQEL